MRLRSRKSRWTILETNLLLRLAKLKRTFAQSLTITELRNFLRLELDITGEEMGSEKRVFKKNNLIRPANKRRECFFVKRREIEQTKTGKSCFLQIRLWLL